MPRAAADKGSSADDSDDSSKLNEQLQATSGRRLQEITGDADQLHGHEKDHAKLRKSSVDYIAAHRDFFEPFLEGESFDAHTARMRKDGVYGGNMELVACAQANHLEIIVHQLAKPRFVVVGDSARHSIHIVYHDSWEHYSSARLSAATSPSSTPASSSTQQSTATKATTSGSDAVKTNAVMKATGMYDLTEIRALLRRHNGDIDAAITDVWEARAANSSAAESGTAPTPPETPAEEMTTTTTTTPAAAMPSGNGNGSESRAKQPRRRRGRRAPLLLL
ncbi:hypothetical protein RI367_000277 [Sorochytrium milnesiophthora]